MMKKKMLWPSLPSIADGSLTSILIDNFDLGGLRIWVASNSGLTVKVVLRVF